MTDHAAADQAQDPTEEGLPIIPQAEANVLRAGIDWPARQHNPVRRMLNGLERLSLWIEAPINYIVRDGRFNPLYHTGPLTVFLLLVILFTGIYLTFFYQFGFTASYKAVASIEGNLIGHLMRALHRYASAAALLTSLLHGWRTFFMDRFRGPRWLAWVSGAGMSALVWAAGVTGYWLVWDERAGVLNQTLINLLQGSRVGLRFLLNNLLTEKAGSGWVFILLVLTVHLGLSLFLMIFFYYHIVRLSRPKLLPPTFWMSGGLALLGLAALFFPAGMLPPLDPGRLPQSIPVDLFFLFYLPAALHLSPQGVWGSALLGLAVVSALPWILKRRPLEPIKIHAERCTGCTLCAADCPYKALQMVERTDGLPHKYVAQLNPNLCVACGVCIGSCPTLALTLGDQPVEHLWQYALSQAAQAGSGPVRVIFTCERHAFQGAQPFLKELAPQLFAANTAPVTPTEGQVRIVPLTCLGMAHPNLAAQAMEAGAAEVQFVGCPPEDCANREGNLWLQQRLAGKRLPKLKSAYQSRPIHSAWLAPDAFKQAVQKSKLLLAGTHATAYETELDKASWRSLLPALALLAGALGFQLALTNVPYTPYPSQQATVSLAFEHIPGRGILSLSEPTRAPVVLPDDESLHLVLEADGQVLLDQAYQPQIDGPSLIYAQFSLPAGQYALRLSAQTSQIELFAGTVALLPGQVFQLHFYDIKLTGDPAVGRQLFEETGITNCALCHSLETGEVKVGPSLAGIASRAGSRVAGLNAKDYLHQSILEPDAYIVEGFPAGQMLSDLGERLSEEQIQDILAFLLTLE